MLNLTASLSATPLNGELHSDWYVILPTTCQHYSLRKRKKYRISLHMYFPKKTVLGKRGGADLGDLSYRPVFVLGTYDCTYLTYPPLPFRAACAPHMQTLQKQCLVLVRTGMQVLRGTTLPGTGSHASTCGIHLSRGSDPAGTYCGKCFFFLFFFFWV